MTRIKICGITNIDDARAAADAGADAVGFVFGPSLRQVHPTTARAIAEALPSHVLTIGVSSNAAVEDIPSTAEWGGHHAVRTGGPEAPDHSASSGHRELQ